MRVKRDAGFTLVELLVTIAIIGVIAVPLGNVVIGFLRNHQATSDRLALSHDAQISAAYFAADVAGVGVRDYSTSPPGFLSSIQENAAYNAGGKVCGTAVTPQAKVRFLSDAWDSAGTVSTVVVAYYLEGTELHRLKCAGASVTDATIAHNVNAATLTVTCSSACTSTTVPSTVTLAFSVTTPSSDPYQITLIGQRRQM